MKKIILPIIAIAATFVLPSCIRKASDVYGETVSEVYGETATDANGPSASKKDTPKVSKTFPVEAFTSMAFEGNYKVCYTQAASTSVKLEAPKSMMDEVTVEVKNGCLHISRKNAQSTSKRWVSLGKSNKHNTVTVYVSTPVLKAVEVYGAVDFTAKQPIKADDLSLNIAGAGDVDVKQITAKHFNLTIAGAGDVELGNIIGADVDVEVSGAGDVDLKATRSENIMIKVNGAGDVEAEFEHCGTVTAAVNGAGDVDLKGTVRHWNQVKNGVASVDTSELVIE